MMYGVRAKGGNHGLVLTRPEVAGRMLDIAGYAASRDLSQLRIVDPAAGEGAFAVQIMKRLHESSLLYGFDFAQALGNVRFYELDPELAAHLGHAASALLADWQCPLPEQMIVAGDFLTAPCPPADIIVGNPPYVRHENIPEEKRALYRELFRTFTHRSDLFIAFYEKSLRTLRQGGVLSFISPNRWLTNQYGKRLRELVRLQFALEHVIDMGDTSPFEESVIAYPAIVTIRKVPPPAAAPWFHLQSLDELAQVPDKGLPSRWLNLQVRDWFGDAYHSESLEGIESQGFKIGIGVATGCDQVFIRKDFKALVEESALLPLIMSKDLKSNRLAWAGNYVLNPFRPDGQLLDLSKYPKLHGYLSAQRPILERRHVAKKNPANWYRTIDRIHPGLTKLPKILMPDISGNEYLFIDEGAFYPHHNLYYITGGTLRDLKILAAILMSDFARQQLKDSGTQMHGGYPRWQSQHLRRLRIPSIRQMPLAVSDALIVAYESCDRATINETVALLLEPQP
jgi:hypothetical protein